MERTYKNKAYYYNFAEVKEDLKKANRWAKEYKDLKNEDLIAQKDYNTLIKKNALFAFKVAIRHYFKYGIRELYNVALEGLFIAAQSFKPEKGAKFTTYAYFKIKQTILGYIEQFSEYEQTGIDKYVFDVYTEEQTEDFSKEVQRDVQKEKPYVKFDIQDYVQNVINYLDTREKIFVKKVYMEGIPKENLTSDLNLSPAGIHFFEKRLKQKLVKISTAI